MCFCQKRFSVRVIVKSRMAQSFRVMVLSEVGRGRLTMAFGADCLQMSCRGHQAVSCQPQPHPRDQSGSVPLGPCSRPLPQAGIRRIVSYQVVAFPFQQTSVSFFQSVSISTAIFRAVATAAFLKPFRAASRTAHDFKGENRLTSRISQVAASNKSPRI